MEHSSENFKIANITPESKQELDDLESKLTSQLEKPIVLVAYEAETH